MKVFKPLKHRSLQLLWGGQVLSSIGDELHKVAFVWLAAGILGNNTGYLTAVQAASAFVLSLFGGMWADRWDHRKTMIWVDVIRGFVVLALPFSAWFGKPGLFVLIFVAIVVSGLSAFFSPALRALIPELVPEKSLLQATNGLMETTARFARIIGPGLIGLFGGLIPLIQFFTVDAVSFFVSAVSLGKIGEIKAENREHQHDTIQKGMRDGITSGWVAIRENSILKYLVWSDGLMNSAWYLVFPLAIGLELHEKMPSNVGALGLVVAAYGVGNVISNLSVGSIHMKYPTLFCWYGRTACGAGFVLLSLAPSLPLMMVTAALAATGGPMTDLSFMALMQSDFKGRDIARIFRLDMTITYGTLLLCYAISPMIFKALSYQMVIGLSGLAMIAISIVGFALFGKGKESSL